MWGKLGAIAPHTKFLVETAAKLPSRPVLGEVPTSLGLPNVTIGSSQWRILLDTDAGGLTYRELLLRWLITRAVVDQGSDIKGVEMWHHGLVDDCYVAGLRFLHDPDQALARYGEMVKIADAKRKVVIGIRAPLWAAEDPGRTPGQYTPFNVDGMRGGKQAHWFLSARMMPALLTARLRSGGLTDLVFGSASKESPSDMARRLRNDPSEGLGWSMGDKACDLFAKWAIGTFHLGEGLSIPWTPADCPLPMDQRVGRVLMRCGFMDEFFGVVRIAGIQNNGLKPPSPAVKRPSTGDPLPSGAWHLTVMNFRRNSVVKDKSVLDWLAGTATATGMTPPKKWRPQDVISALCRSYNASYSGGISPVEFDDFLMNTATPCSDNSPNCTSCPLTAKCQAHNVPQMVGLKQYYT